MKSYLGYKLYLILIVFCFFSIQNTNADLYNSTFSGTFQTGSVLSGASASNQDFLSKIERSISPESDSVKIKKLQSLFSELKLYSGSIDGNYLSIKDALVNYQVKVGIIESSGSDDAGYFGKKTIASLRKDYIDFEEKALRTLKVDEVLPPTLGPKIFTVTAYYSPLPDQEKYLMGSYDADIKLNGKGIKGASGKPVFSGMLAGPKNYPFGTKVYIEGLGIGSVEDRGSAIVSSGNRGYENDRIDVWMGYGDDGLQRALDWGKKTVRGEILESNSKITMNFNENILVISPDKKKQLDGIKNKILVHVEKKYKGNTNLAEKYKSEIKITLSGYISKTKSKEKRQQLIYLREIL